LVHSTLVVFSFLAFSMYPTESDNVGHGFATLDSREARKFSRRMRGLLRIVGSRRLVAINMAGARERRLKARPLLGVRTGMYGMLAQLEVGGNPVRSHPLW
ncbi:MAG: hypothetical protein ACRDHP_00145, partial [Ktedonobacterales bacterium]